jgi:sugar lactone lactonase YvrE
MLRYSLTSLVLAAAAALTACGGGGSSAPATQAPAPVAVQAPAIATQPAAQSVLAGQSATFTVAATGDGLSYQWQRDGKDIAGATSASYTLANVQAADNGASFTVVVKNSGGSVTSASATLKVTAVAGQGTLSLLAGPLGGDGNLDGPVGRFSSQLSNIAVSPTGTLYVDDQVPWQALRVITRTPGQDATVTTLPRQQEAIIGAVDAAGNLYENTGYQIYKRTPAGARTFVAGNVGAGDTVFGSIGGIAVDASGTLYVADGLDHTIKKVTPQGAVTRLAGGPGQSGAQDGIGDAARFMGPGRLAIDKAGNVYVTDAFKVRKITPDGRVTTLAGSLPDGTLLGGDAASFNSMDGISVDASGNVYVLSGNLRRIAPNGEVSHLTPPGSPYGHDPFGMASSLAQDGAGNLYVASTALQQVLRVTPAGEISAIAGKAPQAGSADGQGPAARFSGASGGPASSLYADAQGNIFVAEGDRVRKITPGGDVSTLALPASDSPYWPTTYYTTGYTDGRDLLAFKFGVLSRVDANGNSHFVAGHAPSGASVLTDGVGDKASFHDPVGFIADGQGAVYCLDYTATGPSDYQIRTYVIRKIALDGTVTTLPVANMPWVRSWFVDRDGKLVMATDKGAVLRLELDNSLSTLRPAPAVPTSQTVVAGDRIGNLYVADYTRTEDSEGVVLHKITPGGADTVIAGRPDTKGVVLGSASSLNVVGSMTVGDDGAVYLMTEASLLKLTQ